MDLCLAANSLLFGSALGMADVVEWRSLDNTRSARVRVLWSEDEPGADRARTQGIGVRTGDGEARCLVRKSDMPAQYMGFIVRDGVTWQIIEAAEPDQHTYEFRLAKPNQSRIPGRFQEV